MTTHSKLLHSIVAATAVLVAACDRPAPQAESEPAPPTPTMAVEPAPAPDLVAVVARELADVTRDRDPYSRARRLGTLLPTLGPEAVDAAKQTLENLLLGLRATDYDLLLRYWATYEPEEASRWARKQVAAQFQATAVMAAVSTWAEIDPQRAAEVAWVWTVDSKTMEAVVPIAIVRGWFARDDPPQLQEFMSHLPPGIIRQRAIAAYARVALENQGIEPVMEWVESLPDEQHGYKLAVHRRVVDVLSQIDIDTALKWCEKHCYGPYGINMRNIIGRNWVVKDAPAALEWISTGPPGYQRDLDVRLTWAKWSRVDPDAAVAWLGARITDGELEPWLQSAIAPYALLLAKDSPAEAMTWAEKIPNEQERRNTLEYLARSWRARDEAAAEAWLAESPLSEESRERARAPFRAPPQGRERPGGSG